MSQSSDKPSKRTTIKMHVAMDAENVPESIEWEADEGPYSGTRPCKAMMLSLWDEEAQNTMRIDLWTKKMRVSEMSFLVYQTLMTMSDTYEKATGKKELVKDIRDFALDFAKKAEIAKEKE